MGTTKDFKFNRLLNSIVQKFGDFIVPECTLIFYYV